jgi:hypothetical protein
MLLLRLLPPLRLVEWCLGLLLPLRASRVVSLVLFPIRLRLVPFPAKEDLT